MPRSAPGPPDDALGYRARPAPRPGPAVLVLHSWWGMTSSFTEYADRLAAAGFITGCVDLYGGVIAATPDEAKALRSARRREPMYRTMIRACDGLLGDPACSSHSVALVGFSMGGHWALWLSSQARPEVPQISATVVYYATRACDFHASAAAYCTQKPCRFCRKSTMGLPLSPGSVVSA